jgi:hypothetical protein
MIAITAITSVSRFDNTPGIQFVVALVRSGVSRIFKEAFASLGLLGGQLYSTNDARTN